MADVFLFIRNSSEQLKISEIIEDSVAFLSDDNLNVYKFNNISESDNFVKSGTKIDFAVFEIKTKEDISFLIDFRKDNLDVEIMLITLSTISPMEYLNPKIKPSSLLLSPYDNKHLKDVIWDFISDYFCRRESVSDDKKYIVNTKNGKEYLSFSRIFYVEVREKRVYIRLQNKEYSQFNTLENVLKAFPENFIRCHRSYAFNTNYLSSVKFSENIIYLTHGISVPLSRSYKKEVKELLSGSKP